MTHKGGCHVNKLDTNQMGVLQLICSKVHEQIKGTPACVIRKLKVLMYLAHTCVGVVYSVKSTALCFVPLIDGIQNHVHQGKPINANLDGAN